MPDDDLYTPRINRVVDFISENLDGDLSLQTLAEVACFSRFHFHRIFKAALDETVHGFVRRQRLERAAVRMRVSPDASLTDLALQVGFGGLAEFSRAFKAHFGITPSAWDRQSPMPESKNRQAPEPFPRYGPEELEIMDREGKVQVRVTRLAAGRMAYIRVHNAYGNERLLEAYRDLQGWLDRQGVDYREVVIVGMSLDDPEITPPEMCRYDMGAVFPLTLREPGVLGEILDARGVPAERQQMLVATVTGWEPGTAHHEAGISVRDLSPGNLACVRCRGPLAEVDLAWQYLYRYWLPRSRYQPVDIPAMELFRRLPEEIGWETFDLEAGIALEPLAV